MSISQDVSVQLFRKQHQRPEPERRGFLKLLFASASAIGLNVLAAANAARPVFCPPATSRVYRNAHQYLFQTVRRRTIASRLPGGTDMLWDIFGPTERYVDFHSGWEWTRLGGDWIDRNLARHGTVPWFSVAVDKVIGATAAASYSVDVTTTLQFVQVSRRWCAFVFAQRNAERAIAGLFHPQFEAPYIDVTYTNGLRSRLVSRLVALNGASSTGPSSTSADFPLPVFVEFERPSNAVMSATLTFVLTQHWSGNNATLDAFLLDPPVSTVLGPQGVAAGSGKFDEGISADPSVIGTHRYIDGTALADFVHTGDGNFGVERNYDPAIFGTGASDLTKFPHNGLGKWVNADPRWTLVSSTFSGEGFAPLAAGLGALRIHMPAEPGVHDGSVVGYSGTLAGNAKIFLPEPLFGRLGRIFVRYYVRLGTPLLTPVEKRYHVYHDDSGSPNSFAWTDYTGKFGIGPDHTTSYGGVSGSSGGGRGWQMRLGWAECDAGTGGPDEGGWAPGFHLYDFLVNNPPGYNYGSMQTSAEERWGQRSGTGGVLYAGQWYCIETELKLNTISVTAPSFVPDGELRAWIDGKLVYERTGMVFRTPRDSFAYDSEVLRPCRELGVAGLWLNWYHGGKTVATVDRTLFYTGLVWSKEYIGPMKLT